MPFNIYSYTAIVPQENQLINVTQHPILSNFLAINNLINVNHVGFSDVTNYGKHNYTSFPFLPADPTTAAAEMAVYSKATPGGPNLGELFYRYPSNGTVIQLTGSQTSSGGGTTGNPGFAYLSATVFIVWGIASGIITGANTITFPTGGTFPAFSGNPYQIYYQPINNYSNVSCGTYISSTSPTQWVLEVPASGYTTSIYWMAIGTT